MPDAAVTAAALRIVKLLAGNPPQTVAQLTAATGVTRTAVTEQLDELQAAGFVARDTRPPEGRGRPCYTYRATEDALKTLFVGNQHLLVPAIFDAIDTLGGDSLVERVVELVGRSLADHYNGKITAKNPRARLQRLIELLRSEGRLLDVVTEKGGKLTLHKRSCPFISMADPLLHVCRIDQKMLSAVIGRPVRRVASRHEGAPCCKFEISLR